MKKFAALAGLATLLLASGSWAGVAPVSATLLPAHSISTACEASTLLPTTQTADLDCAAFQMYVNGNSAITLEFFLDWTAATAVHVYLDTNACTATADCKWSTVQRGDGGSPPVVALAPLDLSYASTGDAAWSVTVRDLPSVKWLRVRIVGTDATADTIAVKGSIAP